MRLVTSPNFCAACTEGLWLSLFRRVKIVDSFVGTCHPPDEHSDQHHKIMELKLLSLAQFRNASVLDNIPKESYKITYSRFPGGEPLPEFQNSSSFVMNDDEVRTWFQIEIEFHSDEVRRDPDRLLRDNWILMSFDKCEESSSDDSFIATDLSTTTVFDLIE